MSELKTLAAILQQNSDKISQYQVLVGFDGFVDQMVNIVDEREDIENYKPVSMMTQFGDLIKASSNRSSLREIVITDIEAGGCAVNLGDGISSLGVNLDFYGTMGKPMHNAFKNFSEKCRTCTPLDCEPGLTMAFEFLDGKYMLSSVNQLKEFNINMLSHEFSNQKFLNNCRQSDLLAFTNWTLYPHMTECWKYIQSEVLSKLEHRPYIFIDLVDPRSRSESDISKMMSVLCNFESYGKTIFGGNLNEANVFASLLGIEIVEEEGDAVALLASQIRKTLGISFVAIHCIKGAAYADQNSYYWTDGPYCPQPKKSTGAGDRYNAGFCLGTLLGLEPEHRLLLGNATSGFFVRNGRSGTFSEILELIKAWDNNKLDENIHEDKQ